MNTQTPKITLDALSDYLNSGATLDDVRSMIEMLQNYQEEIHASIDEWYELIPYDGWAYKEVHNQLKTIVTWLRKMGYNIARPALYDGDNAYWIVSLGEEDGALYWKGNPARYSIEGLPRPEESPNDARRMPEFLTWH